jgi:hypothetical protein
MKREELILTQLTDLQLVHAVNLLNREMKRRAAVEASAKGKKSKKQPRVTSVSK